MKSIKKCHDRLAVGGDSLPVDVLAQLQRRRRGQW